MTDYFALLAQPRRPWLNPDELKQTFHARTLQAHPDVRSADDSASNSEALFAEINEAYQVLREPKRRLQHLLDLTGAPRAVQSAAIPPALEDLFPAVAALTQRADAVIEKAAAATNSLSLSLVKGESVAALAAIEGMLAQLQNLHEQATATLREVDERWCSDPNPELPALQGLYLQFSYLARWIAELEERRARLSGAG